LTKFEPRLDTLPAAERIQCCELDSTLGRFTLHGGTALALRLGHRQSVDFDFFLHLVFDPEAEPARSPILPVPSGRQSPVTP
jgi:hypothetical protein